jgi:hypothetical protein
MFRELAFCLCGGSYPTVALADVDANGALDMIVASRRGQDPDTNGNLVVFLNDGANLFAKAPNGYAAGAEPHSLAVGDVDGDGRVDVVTAGACGGSVLLNAGGGRLAGTTPYGSVRGNVILQDVDGDGALDVINTDRNRWTVDVLPNDGEGLFLMPIGNAVQSPVQTAVGDLNGDGRADLVVATETSDRGFSVLLNEGEGRFGAPLNYRVPDAPALVTMALADIDGDGRLDLAVTGDSSVTLFMNRSR